MYITLEVVDKIAFFFSILPDIKPFHTLLIDKPNKTLLVSITITTTAGITMPRKKKGAKAKAVTVEPKHPPKKPKVVEEWEDYFKQGDLSDWLRLMGDLGLRRDYSSITQCRKVSWTRNFFF